MEQAALYKVLHQSFIYNGNNLIWKVSRGLAKAGTIAGTVNSRGYRHIRLYGKFYQAHRLIWLFTFGEIADDLVIDHINQNKLDNRLENLRLVTQSVNQLNNSSSKGYYFCNYHKCWVVSLRLNSKQIKKHCKSEQEANELAIEIRKQLLQLDT